MNASFARGSIPIRYTLFQGSRNIRDKNVMTVAAKTNESAVEHRANVNSSRFEPIKKILLRCDEKTIEYARPINGLAA